MSVTALMGSEGCKKPDPPGDGFLIISFSSKDLSGTQLEKLEEVYFKPARIDVVHRTDCDDPESEQVLRDVGETEEVRMRIGLPNVAQPLTRIVLPPGCVSQVRLIAEEASVVIDGKTEPVRIPSGPQTGLKIIPEETEPLFPIRPGDTTVVRIHFDAEKQLVFTGAGAVLEKPVIRGREVDRDLALGFILDEVVLTFDKGTDQETIEQVVSEFGGMITAQYPREFVTVLLPDTDSVYKAIEFYRAKDSVVTAAPNFYLDTNQCGDPAQNPLPPGTTPTDPFYVRPEGEEEGEGLERLNFESIYAPQAWECTTGSRNVVVAVIDTGFEMRHAELLNQIWINQAEIPEWVNCEDVDGDGRITFVDLNDPVNNRDECCNWSWAEPHDACTPFDLANGDCWEEEAGVYTCEPGYGWQDGMDADGNGFADDLFGWNFKENNNLPQQIEPDEHHGTAVAGLVAGGVNNDLAGLGAAPNVSIMLLRAEVYLPGTRDPRKIKRESMVRAVHYALSTRDMDKGEPGASVIQMSIGTMLNHEEFDPLDPTMPFHDCVQEDRAGVFDIPDDKWEQGLQILAEEWTERMEGLQDNALIVIAGKNCFVNVDLEGRLLYPGGFAVSRSGIGLVHPQMINVANATTWRLSLNDIVEGRRRISPALHSMSNWGEQTIQIAAPGSYWEVLAPHPENNPGNNLVTTTATDCNQKYFRCSGTSFAAPLVSGAAALLMSLEPTLFYMNPMDLKDRILRNACQMPSEGFVEESRFLNVLNILEDNRICPSPLIPEVP